MPFVDVAALHRFAPEKMQKIGLAETDDLFCDIYCLEPGQEQKPHTHDDATKLYYVLEGTGSFLSGDEKRDLSPGSLTWAPPGVPHGIRATDRLVVLAIMSPNPNRKG